MRRRRNCPVHIEAFPLRIFDRFAWPQVLNEHILHIRLIRCHSLELAMRNISRLHFVQMHGLCVIAHWAQHHSVTLYHLPQRWCLHPLLLMHRELIRLTRQFKRGKSPLAGLPLWRKPRPLLTVLPAILRLFLLFVRSFHVRVRSRLSDEASNIVHVHLVMSLLWDRVDAAVLSPMLHGAVQWSIGHMLVEPESHASARQDFWVEPFLELTVPPAHTFLPILIHRLVHVPVQDPLLKIVVTDVLHFMQRPDLIGSFVKRSIV